MRRLRLPASLAERLPKTIRRRICAFSLAVGVTIGLATLVCILMYWRSACARQTASVLDSATQVLLRLEGLESRGLQGEDVSADLERRTEELVACERELKTLERRWFNELSDEVRALSESAPGWDEVAGAFAVTQAAHAREVSGFESLVAALADLAPDLLLLERGYERAGDDYEYHVEELADRRLALVSLRQELYRLSLLPEGEEQDQVRFFVELELETTGSVLDAVRDGDDELELDPTEDEALLEELDEVRLAFGAASEGYQAYRQAEEERSRALAASAAHSEPLLAALQDASQRAQSVVERQMTQLGLGLALAFGIVGLVLFLQSRFLRRSVLASLTSILERVQDVAQGDGDLTQRLTIDAEDELGELALSLNTFLDDIETMIGRILSLSEAMVDLNVQLVSEAEGLEAVSSQQEAADEAVSLNVGDILSQSARALELAQNVESSACSTEGLAKEGSAVTDRVNTIVQGVVEKGAEVETVIELVDQIASKTRFLALNATVEAARAGAAGRSFSVVADEVRALANRSSESSRQTGEIVRQSQIDAQRSFEHVAELVTHLDEISGAAETTTSSARQIVQACSAQATLVESIGRSMETIHSLSGQNRERSRELGAFCDRSQGLASDLRELVGRFRVRRT